MRHLSETELVDLAEATRAESTAPHLQACERCRRQLADLRAAMWAAGGVDVPEPSPLFWDHLSARVSDAVAAEPSRERAGWRRAFAGVRRSAHGPGAAVWSAVGAAALVAVVAVARLSPPRAYPAPHEPAADTVLSSATGTAPLADDPALSLVAQLAESLDYDSASELTPADVTAHPGVVEESVSAMSQGEREELGRLLREQGVAPKEWRR